MANARRGFVRHSKWHAGYGQIDVMAITDIPRPITRLGVLEVRGAADSLAPSLAAEIAPDGIEVESFDDLSSLLRCSDLAVVIVAPEFPDDWPISVATAVIDAIAGRWPLIIVCRSAQDAALLTARQPAGVVVLLRERTGPAELASVVRGELARRRSSAGGDSFA